jgi:hypothetical protein
MSDQDPTDGGQNRRRFLQAVGASSVAAGSIGTAAADHDDNNDEFDVKLFTFAEDFCEDDLCGPNTDYLLPVGAEADFQAQIDGNASVIEVKKKDLETGETETLQTCGDGGGGFGSLSHEDDDDCEQFTVDFDHTGLWEIRVEAFTEDGTIGSPDDGNGFSTLGGGHDDHHDDDHHDHGDTDEPLDCSEIQDLACDSIVCEVIEPEIEVDVGSLDGGDGPYTVGETLLIEASPTPAVEPDDWELETFQVDDEPAEVPEIEAPEAGEIWARRAVGSGTFIATCTATYGDREFSQSAEIEIQGDGEFSYSDAEITTKFDKIFASIDLSNASDDFQTAEVELKTFGEGDETIDSDEVGVLPGEEETVELDGDRPSDAFYAALYLNDESVESKEL